MREQPAEPEAARDLKNPGHVLVYGNDHSPWVQAVLLGLHEKGIAHTLVTLPPLSVFLNSGILMPAAKIDDGPWLLDSARILGDLGFSGVRDEEREALLVVFGGALQRTESSWEFWRRFSYVGDGHPSRMRRLWNHIYRPFATFYFYVVITIARRRRAPQTTEQLRRDFTFWEERLGQSVPFLGGEAPDTVDLQLFGLVQMFGSIPGRSLAVLREDPALVRLREWIGAMQRRFSDYPRLYSGPYFEPQRPMVERSAVYERVGYWLGSAFMWLAFPITLPTVLYFVQRVRRKGMQSQ